MAKNFPKFPETIYAAVDGDGFLTAYAEAGELAERGIAVPAAEYRLVRVGVVVESTTFEPKV